MPDENFTSTISIYDNEGYFNYAMGLNIYTTKLYKTLDAIYLYMNEQEIKNIENITFFRLRIKSLLILYSKQIGIKILTLCFLNK